MDDPIVSIETTSPKLSFSKIEIVSKTVDFNQSLNQSIPLIDHCVVTEENVRLPPADDSQHAITGGTETLRIYEPRYSFDSECKF